MSENVTAGWQDVVLGEEGRGSREQITLRSSATAWSPHATSHPPSTAPLAVALIGSTSDGLTRRLWDVRRRNSPAPTRDRRVLDDVCILLGVLKRQAGAPLDIADERRAKLRIIRQLGVVSGLTHRRSEAKALLPGDTEVSVMGEHPGIAAQSFRVVGRSPKHLGPPQDDVSPVVLADAAWKQRTEHVISFDTVVEGIDQTFNSRGAARPVEESGHAAHPRSVLAMAPCTGHCSGLGSLSRRLWTVHAGRGTRLPLAF
jgi:hypothetical protein